MCQMFAEENRDRYKSATRRLRLNGQSTSIRLEGAFWDIVDQMAEKAGMTTPAFLSKLHSEMLELHGETTNFTSMLRCACTLHMDTLGQDLRPDGRIAVA